MDKQLKIGWGHRITSTDKPVGITGQLYMRISQGIRDDITCTALAIDNGTENFIMVSLDTTMIRPIITDQVRELVRQELPEVNAGKISFSATHTHTAAWATMAHPGTIYPLNPAIKITMPEEYYPFFIRQITDAVKEAWLNRKPGKISYGIGMAPVSRSRRVWFTDDLSKRPDAHLNFGLMVDHQAQMYGDTEDPRFSHFEAGADHSIQFLYTFDEKDKLTGIAVNVPCPSQFSMEEETLSADYWHNVRETVKKQLGDELFILPLCAPAGDLETFPLHNLRGEARRLQLKGTDRRQEIAEAIVNELVAVLDWAQKEKIASAEIKNELVFADLPARMLTKEEYEEELAAQKELDKFSFKTDGTPEEQLKYNSVLSAMRNRNKGAIQRYEKQDNAPARHVPVHIFVLGDIAFATNAFELFSDYMHRIQGRSPFVQTFCVQLTDDYLGYLATERGASGGGYSASRYCNQVSPAGGQMLVDVTVEYLDKLCVNRTPMPKRRIETPLLYKLFEKQN